MTAVAATIGWFLAEYTPPYAGRDYDSLSPAERSLVPLVSARAYEAFEEERLLNTVLLGFAGLAVSYIVLVLIRYLSYLRNPQAFNHQ